MTSQRNKPRGDLTNKIDSDRWDRDGFKQLCEEEPSLQNRSDKLDSNYENGKQGYNSNSNYNKGRDGGSQKGSENMRNGDYSNLYENGSKKSYNNGNQRNQRKNNGNFNSNNSMNGGYAKIDRQGGRNSGYPSNMNGNADIKPRKPNGTSKRPQEQRFNPTNMKNKTKYEQKQDMQQNKAKKLDFVEIQVVNVKGDQVNLIFQERDFEDDQEFDLPFKQIEIDSGLLVCLQINILHQIIDTIKTNQINIPQNQVEVLLLQYLNTFEDQFQSINFNTNGYFDNPKNRDKYYQ